MRRRLYILALTASALIAAACQTMPGMTLSRNRIDAAPEGGVYGVTLAPGGGWEATADCDWVVISGGDRSRSSEVLILTVAPNELSDPRTCTVKVVAADVTQEIVVSQPRRLSRILRVVHSRPGFSAPVLSGEGAYGTIAWGDGVSEEYSAGAVHSYSAVGEYVFEVESYGAGSVSMTDLTDVVKIDLSDF